MTWRRGLFVHWPVDPERIRRLLPDPLEPDTRNGRAWTSVLPFVLADTGLRFSPRFARLTFPEVNVRTYVRLGDTPGLYFFDVDVGHRLLARTFRATTRLPCHPVDATVRSDEDRVIVRSERTDDSPGRFAATYRPDGEVFRADPGTLDHWLVERRRMFDPGGRGVLVAEVGHEPWPLQPAEVSIHENTLLEAAGLPEPTAEPRVRYCERLRMTGSIPRVMRP